jgi:hypothetical protein
MEGEGSPVINIVDDMSKALLPEALTSSSSSDSSLGEASSDVSEAGAGDTIDPRELAWSYDFEMSSVTVGRIRQLESLGYFVEGSAREPGEETIPEPNDDEVVVFEEFFTVGL